MWVVRATWRLRSSAARLRIGWAVEGAKGVGLGLVQRLVAEGEAVLNVPTQLSARVRVFHVGSGRRPIDSDAYEIALAALRAAISAGARLST